MQHSNVDMVIHGGLIVSSTSADVASVAIIGGILQVHAEKGGRLTACRG